MAKTKTVFYCTNCGNETPKWMGRCPSCGAYNTMEEHVEKPVAAGKAKSAPVGMSRKPQRIREITSDGEIRFSTGMGELDRVLGGGVPCAAHRRVSRHARHCCAGTGRRLRGL